MFEKLVLRHFQPHKKLTIEFGERVTCIVGPTDTGKSSVLRALRWICLNRIGSRSFISWWSKFTTVTLYVDGHVIRRRKGKANLYEMDGQEFKAFGTTVPEPIARVLNVSEENFQRQIDPPLWLAESPAQVGRELNKIVNLDIIDHTMEAVAKRKREAQSKVSSLTEVRNKLKREVRSLSWVTECRKEYEELEGLVQNRDRLRDKVGSLEALLGNAQRHKRVLKCQPVCEVLSGLLQRWMQVAKKVVSLGVLLEEAQEHSRTVENAGECLVAGKSMAKNIDRSVELSRTVSRLQQQLDLLCDVAQRADASQAILDKAQKQLAQVKECPVCQSPMKS